MAKFCHCLRFPSFLTRYLLKLQGNSGVPGLPVATSFLLPTSRTLHLSAILENSALRLDCVLLRQVSLYLTNLFDRVLSVSSGFLTQLDSAVKELVETGETRCIVGLDFAMILFSFLFLHPFRQRFGAAGQAEILSAAQ